MPVKATPRSIILLVTGACVLGLIFATATRNQPIGMRDPNRGTTHAIGNAFPHIEKGHSIMPKLGNETAKAELGRATWKYFHSVMARFPDTPTKDEKAVLSQYIHLFQRLYPCGECADHFGDIIQAYPPQVSSRSAAAAWACHVHNEVNKSLEKELFDCTKIGDFYDCGCAEDEKDVTNDAAPA